MAKKEVKGFVLGSVKVNEDGEWMDVIHPTEEEETGWRIKLAGMGTKAYNVAESTFASRRLKGINIKSRKQIKQALENLDQATEDIQQNQRELLAEITLDWEGVFDEKGAAIPFTKELALQVYEEYSWLEQQVREFVSDRANFIKG